MASSCSETSGIALHAQLLLQKKSMEQQQSNVLQLVESVTGSEQGARPSDGVRGKVLDIIA
jgi:hypothetical protein